MRPTLTLATSLLVLATLAIYCAFDRMLAGPDAQWDGAGAAGLSWYALWLLAIAWVASCSTSPTVSFERVLFVLASLAPLGVLGILAADTWGSDDVALWAPLIFSLAALIYLAFRISRVGTARTSLAVATTAAGLALLGWTSSALYIDTQLWYAAHEADEPDSTERLFFAQSARIDAALAQLAPADDARPTLYFLGFAGYGNQKVFASEVDLAARTVGERYGTDARTVLLVNDARDLDSRPLATVSGLRHAVAGIAARMRLDRDALFLFLTSHGSEGGELAVSNADLPMDQLSAGVLAEALDESGIEWRVIVISACYAGAFIETLRNDRTIVLTAAAADRTSFGCTDERELTYFGEALFKDALPHATSLLDAFEEARNAIAGRESRERVEPSLPIVFLGKEMAERWPLFEQNARRD